MRKGNIVTGIICALLAIYILVTSMGYPTAEAYGTGVPGPGLWPGLIAALLLITSIGLIVGTFMTKKDSFGELNLWTPDTKRAYISMAILIVYVLVLPTVGFIISSVVMLIVFIQWFSKMKIWKTILVSVAATLAVYFVFKSLLDVPVDFGMFCL